MIWMFRRISRTKFESGRILSVTTHKTLRSQDGFSLLEVLLSIALIAIIVTTFFAGLGTGSKALFVADQHNTAKELAQSQMEYVKQQPYLLNATSYSAAPLSSEYAAYTVDIDCENARDSTLQKITITTSLEGTEVYRLEGYKVQ